MLLLGGLLLPLAAPLFLACAASDILANLLSSNPFPRLMAAYHSAAIIPAVIVAAYYGYRRVLQKQWIRPARFNCVLLGIAFLFPCLAMGYPFAFWELSTPVLAPDQQAIEQIRSVLPSGPICAQINIGVFFSGRDAITPYPYGLEKATAVVLRIENPYSAQSLGHFDNPFHGTNPEFAQSLHGLMQRADWHVTYWNAPWLVMKRGAAIRDEGSDRRAIEQRIDELK
jgi:hypothetical protein